MSKNGDTHSGKFRRQLIQTVIYLPSSPGVHQKRPVSTQKAGITARQMKITHYVVSFQRRTICQ